MSEFELDDESLKDILGEDVLKEIEEAAMKEVEQQFEKSENKTQIEDSVRKEMGLGNDFNFDDVKIDDDFDLDDADFKFDLDEIDLSDYELDLDLDMPELETTETEVKKEDASEKSEDSKDKVRVPTVLAPAEDVKKKNTEPQGSQTKIRLLEDSPEEQAKRKAFKKARQKAIEEQTKKAVVEAKQKAQFKVKTKSVDYGPSVFKEESEEDLQKKKMRNIIIIGVAVFVACIVLIFVALTIKNSKPDPESEEKYKAKIKEKNSSQNKPHDLHSELNTKLKGFRSASSSEEKLKFENEMRDLIDKIKKFEKYYNKKKNVIDRISREIDNNQ